MEEIYYGSCADASGSEEGGDLYCKCLAPGTGTCEPGADVVVCLTSCDGEANCDKTEQYLATATQVECNDARPDIDPPVIDVCI